MKRKPIYKSKFPYFSLVLFLTIYSVGFGPVLCSDSMFFFTIIFCCCLLVLYIISWFHCFLKFYDTYLEISYPTRLFLNKTIQIKYESLDKIYYSNSFLGNKLSTIIIKYYVNDKVLIKKFIYTDFFINEIKGIMHQIEMNKFLYPLDNRSMR